MFSFYELRLLTLSPTPNLEYQGNTLCLASTLWPAQHGWPCQEFKTPAGITLGMHKPPHHCTVVIPFGSQTWQAATAWQNAPTHGELVHHRQKISTLPPQREFHLIGSSNPNHFLISKVYVNWPQSLLIFLNCKVHHLIHALFSSLALSFFFNSMPGKIIYFASSS